MSSTRRDFLLNTSFVGAGLAVTEALGPLVQHAAAQQTDLTPYLTGIKMAATPATAYRAYRSKALASADVTTWVQVDLGKRVPIETVQLFPASERMYPGRDGYYAGEGFPLRFRIDASDDAAFAAPITIANFTHTDFPDPKDNITQFSQHDVSGRYVRLTATRLRAVKAKPIDTFPLGGDPPDSPDFTLTLAKMSVLSGGKDVAVSCKAAADPNHGNAELIGQLTRPSRQDGEGIHYDNPKAVTDPSTWTTQKYKAQAPRTGVTLEGGLFQTAMQNNIEYLLTSYSTDDLLRQFYERTGKVRNFKPTGSQIFWEEDLAGSNAGRFLMGAANTIRWIDHPELRRRVNVVVDGIEECRQPNGYIMAYPEGTIFYSERAAYTRAWLTHGLLEAAYAGNSKALPMLRGYYDWFNQQAFLPKMLRGAIQGGQGMVANTRMGTSPMGKPLDAQVIQRYYQENAWLTGLAKHEKEQVWQYPYDRPHCYLLTNLEAYLDMFLITGDPLYYDAVLGAWELYRAHWQQAGGSISIIEFEEDPPDSNYLRQKLGELCANSFWVFLSQRFQLLNPNDERYATEIEKSIYNVAFANQDGANGLRYHTILEGKKEKATRENTCCEGQGTRLLGSLPEHIFSIAPDGLYIHLYEPSTIRWQQDGQPMELAVKTHFPYDTAVRCMVKAGAPTEANLRVRIPSWAAVGIKVSVNGKPAGTGEPGTYLSLRRKWSSGDTIEFVLPAAIRVKPYKGEDQLPGKSRYSVEYGPILLAAVGSSQIELFVDNGLAAEQLANYLEQIEGSPLHFAVRGNAGQKLIPYWQVSDEEFTCYPVVRTRA
jgi:DUF1680 family protein